MPAEHVTELISTASQFARQGWLPASAGNFSLKTSHAYPVQITKSGCFKDALTEADFLRLNYNADLDPSNPQGLNPSAETPLHLYLYQRFTTISNVLHVHSPAAVVLSKKEYERHKRTVEFHGFELQKALPGVTSHEGTLSVPLFPNSQDMSFLVGELENTLLNRDCCFLLAGHGLYAWGENLQETRRIIEAVEELCRYSLYEDNRL